MAARTDVKIKEALERGLASLTPSPDIIVTRSRVRPNWHVYVVTPAFARMSLVKRHDLVEGALVKELDKKTLVRISALFLLTPEEADGCLSTSTPSKSRSKATAAARR